MIHCRRYHRTPQQIMATAVYWSIELNLSSRSRKDSGTHAREAISYRDSSTPAIICSPQVQILNVDQRCYQTQSYIPPVTRSQTANRARVIESRLPPPRFEPRRKIKQDTTEAIADLVSKPFGHAEHKEGYIYMFTRESDPGYVKIGWSKNVKRRMGEWERRCGYKPVLAYQSPRIPHAFRVEQLIFTQLAGSRYNDMRCINEGICGARHKEWFKLRTRDAKEIIERWIDWVLDSPYDETGRLEDSWATYLDQWLEQCHQDLDESDLDLHFGRELPNLTAEDSNEDADDTDEGSEYALPPSEESKQDLSSSIDDECAICREEMESPTERTIPPCTLCRNCSWHDECIRKWIEMSPSCPMCRSRDTIDVPAGSARRSVE